DTSVRVLDERTQHLLRRLAAGRVRLEYLLGRADRLFSRHGAAGLPAHAVGDHRQQHAAPSLALKDRQPVLLLVLVSNVLAGGGVDDESHYAPISAALIDSARISSVSRAL